MRLAYRLACVLVRAGASAATVTLVGIAASVGALAAGFFHAQYWIFVAAGLVMIAAVADTLDSAIIVLTGRLTRLGYIYNSVADRIVEACWLGALVFAGAPGWLAAAAGGVSWLHEYVRARAIAAGMNSTGEVTMGERPMRVIVAVAGLTLSGLTALISTDLGVGAAAMAGTVWLLLGIGGFIQLLDAVHDALG